MSPALNRLFKRDWWHSEVQLAFGPHQCFNLLVTISTKMNATWHSKSRLIHSLRTYYAFSWGLFLCSSRKNSSMSFFSHFKQCIEIKVDLIVFRRQWPFRGILLCYHLEVNGLYETVQIFSRVHPLCCVFHCSFSHIVWFVRCDGWEEINRSTGIVQGQISQEESCLYTDQGCFSLFWLCILTHWQWWISRTVQWAVFSESCVSQVLVI